MKKEYQHLGPFSDLAKAAKNSHDLWPSAAPGRATQKRVREVLGFCNSDGWGEEMPRAVKVERRWERDGVEGEEISWSVGFGPRVVSWLLRPVGQSKPLPGILALHDHGGYKYYGKEKIAIGPDENSPSDAPLSREGYGGRAFANELARRGFVVLATDVFLWGSRKWPFELMPDLSRNFTSEALSDWEGESISEEIARYNCNAAHHEHLVEKYCRVLGTTFAAIVAYEDRIAANYLASRKDVANTGLGCVGASGGGMRAAFLQATSRRIKAAAVVVGMTTYEGLLDHNLAGHTWKLFPAEWPRYGDWPDLAACRAPSPLLVQYALEDTLFSVEGMKASDRKMASHYRAVGAPKNYIGQFFPGPHRFDVEMQDAAFDWLTRHLKKSKS